MSGWVEFWKSEAERYHDHVGASRRAYHEGRLATATRLLERAELPRGARVVDFGCGDGVYSRRLAAMGFDVKGIDLVEEMVVLARAKDPEGVATYATGGAAQLASAGPSDAIVSLNVLAYLTDGELADFWAALEEILEPGGFLLVSHSNALFDRFAGPPPVRYNVRANPLTYADELAGHGLDEVARAYFNLHPKPPSRLGEGDEGRILDPDEIARVPETTQQLQCSTLFSLSRRV